MIRAIVAIDEKQGIAKHGFQPWYIPEDDQYFSDQTKQYGGNVLMGQRTFEIIGEPLAGRHNYVLTRNPGADSRVEYVTDLTSFLSQFEVQGRDMWVIGGASVYAQTLQDVDELYITRIQADFGCDQFFPEFVPSFGLRQAGEQQEQNGFRFRFEVYSRLT